MGDDVALPRWLIVVRRDRCELFENLRASFVSDPRIQVILDRRQAEGHAVGPERRRAPLSGADRSLWDAIGFRLVYRGDDVTVYEEERRGVKG